MFAQPMSSPMMKMMLGRCCCCADAVPATVTVANNVTTASQTILVMLMVPTILSELLRRPTVCVQLVSNASMAHEAVILGPVRVKSSDCEPGPTIGHIRSSLKPGADAAVSRRAHKESIEQSECLAADRRGRLGRWPASGWLIGFSARPSSQAGEASLSRSALMAFAVRAG